MSGTTKRASTAIVAGLLLIGATSAAHAEGYAPVGPEEIVIARSIRTSRIAPSAFCSKAGEQFGPIVQDTYDFVSVQVRESDGRVSKDGVAKSGELEACFGRTEDPSTVTFFAEGKLVGVTFRGLGNCVEMASASPADGIVPFRCFMALSNLPDGYAKGLLTTNTVGSRNVLGEAADPPGYTQASIATVRLWRK